MMRFEGNCRSTGVVLTWEPVGKWRKVRLEVCDMLRTLSCALKPRKQAGDSHSTNLSVAALWRMWGWGLIHGANSNPGRMREGRVEGGFQRWFDQSKQSCGEREERSRSLGFCLRDYIDSDFIQYVVKFRRKRVWGKDGSGGAWC